MLPGVQTGNGIPHDKYDVGAIAHVCTNRKDNIFMKRQLNIDEAHTALDIFRFAVFFSTECNFYAGSGVVSPQTLVHLVIKFLEMAIL